MALSYTGCMTEYVLTYLNPQQVCKIARLCMYKDYCGAFSFVSVGMYILAPQHIHSELL